MDAAWTPKPASAVSPDNRAGGRGPLPRDLGGGRLARTRGRLPPDLEQLGVVDAVAGLVFGRPYGYDEERAQALWGVVAERTAAAGIPVLANVDLGHTIPC